MRLLLLLFFFLSFFLFKYLQFLGTDAMEIKKDRNIQKKIRTNSQ